jgi:hypothetical protein
MFYFEKLCGETTYLWFLVCVWILEVLVKEEHDFYREKWQKEQNKRSGVISHVIRCDTL